MRARVASFNYDFNCATLSRSHAEMSIHARAHELRWSMRENEIKDWRGTDAAYAERRFMSIKLRECGAHPFTLPLQVLSLLASRNMIAIKIQSLS